MCAKSRKSSKAIDRPVSRDVLRIRSNSATPSRRAIETVVMASGSVAAWNCRERWGTGRRQINAWLRRAKP